MEEKHSKKAWWIILTVLVLLSLAFWLFYWRNISSEFSDFPFIGKSQNSDLLVIEKEINAMDLINLDSDLASMEKEINQ